MSSRMGSPPPPTPASLKHSSKWRAVLALLPTRSTKPLPRQSALSISSASSSSSAPPTHINHESSPCANPAIAHRGPTCADADLLASRIAPPMPSDAAPNFDHLLHTFSSSDDIEARARILDTLCTLCAETPSVADRCVAAGGIEIVLKVLSTSTSQITAEECEKALLLLHLMTALSADGCAAALRQSMSMISILGKKLLRISEACTASAIAVLSTLCYHSAAAQFRRAVAETAIPSKLVVVLQVASEDSTKQGAGRLLRIITNK